MQKTILSNGLTVVSHTLPGTASLTALVLSKAGSRHESRAEAGLAHFLEHMFFKGGVVYTKPKEVAEAIDGVGGDFNAFTGKEYAGYYVKAAAKHGDTALGVLSDMLISATFPEEEIEKERGVILEEYNMYQDTPMYQVGWDFEHLLYGDQPMGFDQIGTKETINAFTRKDFVAFKERFYQPKNTVVALAGAITHEEAVAKVQEFFKFPEGRESPAWEKLTPLPTEVRVKIQDKKTEQGHLVIGALGVPLSHKDHYAQRVLAALLGGNMSSRMFTTVREEKGLCYSVRTSTDDYTDSGVVSTYAGVTLAKAEDAIRAIVEEYAKIAAELPTEAEVSKAKEYLKGKITLRLEDSEEYAHFIGRNALLGTEELSPEEVHSRIDAVTGEDITRLAREIFTEDSLRIAAIGPFAGKEEAFAQALRSDATSLDV